MYKGQQPVDSCGIPSWVNDCVPSDVSYANPAKAPGTRPAGQSCQLPGLHGRGVWVLVGALGGSARDIGDLTMEGQEDERLALLVILTFSNK